MTSVADFSETIRRIYAAAADPQLWPDALQAIEHYSGSLGAVIDLVPKHRDVPGSVLAGSLPPELCEEFARDYMPICRRVGNMMSLGESEVQTDAMILSEAEMDRDPVYEWLGKQDLRYHIGARLPSTPLHDLSFSIQRTLRQGHAQAADIALFNLIAPHVVQAISLAESIGGLSDRWRFSLALLDNLPQAVFALDEQGAILFANRNGEAMLKEGDGLIAANGALSCRHAGQRKALERAIAGAAAPGTEGAGGWLRIERASGRLGYAVLVAPLEAGEADLSGFRPRLLAVAYDPARRIEPDEAALRALYGLTGAEARIAAALAGGHSVDSTAAALGITVGTVRSHVKSVFGKTGVNRQQDLVRLVGQLR